MPISVCGILCQSGLLRFLFEPVAAELSIIGDEMPRVSAPYRIDDADGTEEGFDAAPDTLSEDDAELLLGYLRSAECIVAAPGVIEDPFVPGNPNARVRIGLMTDGEWVWELAWEDYVEYRRVAPPIDFIDHAKRHGWVAPEVSEQVLLEMARQFGFESASDLGMLDD
ncbi:hypothetical protein KHQ06_37255 [Nocardia tengchongensis]|uniref:Uncharacterized protein n=2 Tax=Nocardia tengchongensis TaxID=2055889 RepID=A0ABX8CNK7_9NOCA|nr:hypothetical protein [Nocardia tengchongensis]QVI21512.1 hypothetical protein KHQ06_37255 [Nocardia tengchongensis]